MSAGSLYLHREVEPDQRPQVADRWVFAGIDLAPNDGLETGVAAVDRDKHLLRLDKLNTDEQIVKFVESLGPGALVALDVPKSLSIPGRWRQEEIKMYPLRLERNRGENFVDRCSARAWALYYRLNDLGLPTFLYFNHTAKTRYDLFIPFRTRTPRGCRALQAVIDEQLALDNMPKNLAPSSVLDAMVGAYAAWSVYAGSYGHHYRFFTDRTGRLILEPLKRVLKG